MPSGQSGPSKETPPHTVPTIRLISATPSAVGSASDASTSFSAVAPFASSPLAPRTDAQPPRKRIVPKKSKLGLLGGGGKTKEKPNKDFSDVVRRVGGETASTGRGGFEIYVDHAEDPDFGEIVVVKKKKSRLALDGMKWGALGEVTNVPSVAQEQGTAPPIEHLLKVKGDDSQKWWSIGRGRKDSKGKNKENDNPSIRSKTPEPVKSLDSRARFNSLDSGIMLSSSIPREARCDSISSSQLPIPLVSPIETAPQTANGLLAPDANPPIGSIAVRAIKSMRSLAHMASWAQLTNNGEKEPEPLQTMKTKEKEKGETKKKKKKDKKEDKVKKGEKERTVRWSGSSFEAGALSAQGSPLPAPMEGSTKTLGRKKQSVLGLGLPSTMRLTAVRPVSSSSSASAFVDRPQAPSRLSVDSAHLIMNAQGRPTSIMSNGSSLRPPSTASGGSMFSERTGRSSSSSVASVRWDEEGLRSSKELQRKERRSREDGKTARAGKDSRRSSEARKRTAISEIFPETQTARPASLSPPASMIEGPIVHVEEATADGHSDGSETHSTETPAKRNRPRPVSEQMLGRTRPQPICDDADGSGVLSILDAATNDLASLINRLDLEATPGSTTASPFQRSPIHRDAEESPLKKRAIGDSPLKLELRGSMASIQSLRPYAQAQRSVSATTQQPTDPKRLIGQQIAPWSELNWQVSPKKGRTSTVADRPTHKRTLTPTPTLDLPFVFQPLRPAKAKAPPVVATSPPLRLSTPPVNNGDNAAPSSATFGSRPSKVGLKISTDENDAAPSPTPVFRISTNKSQKSLRKSTNHGMPILPEARKGLGLTGTLGGPMSSEPPVDPEDPDSDIPDELQVILSGQSDDDCTRRLDDTLSSRHSSSPSSPISPLEVSFPYPLPEVMDSVPSIPALQLYDEEANHADIDEGANGSSSEDDTKKSFDFTGELQKLNESGASDRRSFVEQLENAFRTPARVELGYDLGEQLGLNSGFLAVPPVPALPAVLRPTPSSEVAPRSVSNFAEGNTFYDNSSNPMYRDSCVSEDMPFALHESTEEDECRIYPISKRSGSMCSKASDGQLNVDFKFGGIPQTVEEVQEKPLTLTDIIPPLFHARSTSRSSIIEEDSSVLKSILAKAVDVSPVDVPPVPRRRALSDCSSRRSTHGLPDVSYSNGSHGSHSRRSSELSFAGLESFDEIRRGFEFGPNRPTFYPPPGAISRPSRPSHWREQSMFSIASVSSYGDVINSGSMDPFGYGASRPPSVDMSVSVSMSVDDTFSFIHRGRRQRVDSDASSFYFNAASQMSHSNRRGHRRLESGMSVASNAPPVSLYNRSFGAHRRNDSNTSASSMAHSYAMYGAHGGRAVWARHRQDPSIDSTWSEYSASRLARPGLGDKMFDNEHGVPLTAISASPPESVVDDLRSRASWDSFIDDGRRSSVNDSLFEKTDYRTSMSSDSVFGFDGPYSQYAQELPTRQFRPLSVMSEASAHSPRKDDDTMITMLDGGHVRRLSVNSMIGGSPCARVGKMRRPVGQLPQAVLQFQQEDVSSVDSPNKSRLIEKPSIASTSSQQFGGERMIMARKGLLERQSLEDSALIAHGEDLLESLRSQSIFSRPTPASRSRSSTVTTSSGGETPPLSSSDGSSLSSGSQSSIDIGHLNTLLLNTTFPSSGVARARARARARGTGHRRRISQARASRSSVYETIQEESSVSGSPSPVKVLMPEASKLAASPPTCDSVIIVDGDSESIMGDWDNEHGITTLRRYYTLRDEAHETVTESQRIWADTPFSVFAVQSFRPPRNRGGMQAMLEHSQKNYGPLPSELRPHRVRSRTSSRASPYPLCSVRASMSPDKPRSSPMGCVPSPPSVQSSATIQPVLREVSVNANTGNVLSPPPALDAIKPFTPFSVDFDASKHGKANVHLPPLPPLPPLPIRPRVTSSARRTALGWSKRSTGKSSSSDQKENISQGMLITPSETLRINRPRPRGRPTPARGLASAR
ncbi:uncharacterized protein FIBRA_07525 [Fibroporia radiculosa]|uniref:Uncharacterized protein n=1 Tax=Fibroporia radiculosa TaxID=599839 RepID=J4IBV3_9APHY|nr:uncharacterized protein FIBRA_07525 [Fibroporia radiculosa]CCM05311.1 predicted protein [Fibroporia radiculosa]